MVSADSSTRPESVAGAADRFGTPLYLYDEAALEEGCRQVLSMPSAFGLGVRYAMKACPTRALLQLICSQGLDVDASSLAEARRAVRAGVAPDRIMLTGQEVPGGSELEELEELMAGGLVFNAGSLRQLSAAGPVAASLGARIGIRFHPVEGSGANPATNTGAGYSSFGVRIDDLPAAMRLAGRMGVEVGTAHVHIGSGSDPQAWIRNVARSLDIVNEFYPHADTLNLGGGFRVARMPDETPADIGRMGLRASGLFEDFARRTGRRLRMEVEPGTCVVAGSGYLVARVMDVKMSGGGGPRFVVLDGGMESNPRPLLYGSRHPFSLVRGCETVWNEEAREASEEVGTVVVGKCCETGDCFCLDEHGRVAPRRMARARPGDLLAVGGCGAYCSSMAPSSYNSHLRAPEVLLRTDGSLYLIRRRQRPEELVAGEQVAGMEMVETGV